MSSTEAALEQVSLAPETKVVVPRPAEYMGSAILSDPSPSINDPRLSSVFHCPRLCLQRTELGGQKGRCSEDLSTSASGCREDRGISTLALTSELYLV